MSVSRARKPLALTALLASTAAMTALTGVEAHATTSGDPTLQNELTIDTASGLYGVDGNGNVNYSPHSKLPPAAPGVAWSSQSGRLAYGYAGAIWTADPDGFQAIRIANLPDGSETPALAWDPQTGNVVWAQGLGGNERLVYAAPDGSTLAAGPQLLVDQATLTKAGIKSIDALDFAGDGSMVVQAWDGAVNGDSIMLLTRDGGGWHFSPVATSSGGVWFTQPTISPDGDRIVFASGGQLHLTTRTPGTDTWTPAAQVTFAAGAHTDPVFMVDGRTVAFEFQADGGSKVVTSTADVTAATATANPSEKLLIDSSGSLSVRTDYKAHVYRFAGTDRFNTAIQASTALWRNDGDAKDTTRSQAEAVVLARSDVFADALGGAGLASAKQGPLLLTATAALTPATQTEIQRILPAGGTVYVLGGEGAISPAVAAKLASLGYTVQRIGGRDRYETAADIAAQTVAVPSQVLVATGDNYPDALSAGAVAASHPGTVVLLSDNNAMPQATQTYLQNMDIRSGHQLTLWGIGHQGVNALTSAGWTAVHQAAGDTRYSTSLLVARDFFPAPTTIAVATGANFPDALSAGAFLGRFRGPLLLVDPKAGIDTAAWTWLDSEHGTTSLGFIFGGTGALPRTVDVQLGDSVSTSSGVTITDFNGSLAQGVEGAAAGAKTAASAQTGRR